MGIHTHLISGLGVALLMLDLDVEDSAGLGGPVQESKELDAGSEYISYRL
jgi:hypothetical protein